MMDLNAKQNIAAIRERMLVDDGTRVDILVRRLQKAMGSKVKARVALSALAILAGRVFTVIPRSEHPLALHQFQHLIDMAVVNEYTPEEREEARQRALAAVKRLQEQSDGGSNAVENSGEQAGTGPGVGGEVRGTS